MKRVSGLVSVIAMMTAVLLVVSDWVSAAEDETTRVSISTDGTQGNGSSDMASVSGDGRIVAFTSGASNLVAGDSNGALDVFVHDRETGETELVSVSSNGAQGDSSSQRPSVSGDGRFVAFDSFASNLVAGDSNDALDVFVHDRETGETSRLSVSSDGMEGNDISLYQSVSADGRFVAFHSAATNLVAEDTNGVRDVFVHDRETGDTSRVSVSTDGDQANDNSFGGASVSGDGRFVAFESFASNLVVGDSNGALDVFVHDRETGEMALVSVSSDGDQGNANSAVPSVSGDGRFVAFQSSASNLVGEDTNNRLDIFVRDRETGDTSRVNLSSEGVQSDDNSFESSVSADGRFVAFTSFATNLVTGDSNGVRDIFVHDRETGEMSRVSVSSDGAQANHLSDRASLSDEGQFVAFESVASNLVAGDTNGSEDVFVHQVYPDLPLEADGRRERGVHVADLTWTGTAAAEVDIVRDGEVVATVPNDGSHTDETGGRGRATYTYQVCVAGTSTCSNEATVRFGGPPS